MGIPIRSAESEGIGMIEHLVSLSMRYKLLVVLVFSAVCAAGIVSITRISIDAFPDVSPNLVQVFAEVEGAAPEEVEQLVSRPVELAMMGLPGVDRIRSLSSYGLSTVNVYFKEDVPIYTAHQLVSERLKTAEERIPSTLRLHHGLQKGPMVSGMGKVLSYYLKSSDTSGTELRTLQDWVVKPHLLAVAGVGDIVSQGGHVRQYQVRVVPERLLKYGLAFSDVVDALEKNNLNTGAGVIERGSEELIVRSIGLLTGIDDIRRIVLASTGGLPVCIDDVADVVIGKAFRRGVALLNGQKEVVVGSIYKAHGANSFKVIEELKKRIKEVNEVLPGGVEIVSYYDQSHLVRKTITTVRNALALGLALVCLVAFLFLRDVRNAVTLVLSLPFSLLLAFTLMHLFDMPGDLISFGGIAVGLGMIIDASIIMVEKIQSEISKGGGRRPLVDVIAGSAKEVGRPIFFAVFIIIAVFIPVFTLQNVEGRMFRPLAFSVTATMAGSLVYALFAAPAFYLLLHRKSARKKEKKRRKEFSLHPLYRLYRAVLCCCLRRRKWVPAAVVILLAAGGFLYSLMGSEFVPTLREGDLQVLAHMDPNISLREIAALSVRIQKDVMKVPEVENVLADIGYGEVGPHIHHTNFVCLTASLAHHTEWKTASSQEGLVAALSESLGSYPGVTFSFSQPIQHELDVLVAGSGSQVAAKLFGPDLEVLTEKVKEVERVLAGISGAADLQTDQFTGQTHLNITMKRDALARHGLNTSDVQELIAHAVGGIDCGRVFEGEKAFSINVRFAEKYRDQDDDIENLLVRTDAGYTVPVGQLAEIGTATGLRQMRRENTRRYIAVRCNVRGRDPGGFVAEAQKKVAGAVALPPDYHIMWGGQFELQQAANRRLAIIIPLTLFVVLVLLYGLFGSLSNVMLIMLNIPVALVGGVAALYAAGGDLSIPASIGFIALFGIAITDGLVLLSRFELLKRSGSSLQEVIVEGALSKLRPVLMTTVTTSLGLLPLLMSEGTGARLQRPLAVVVIGGLVSSTFLTLIVLPVLYSLLPHKEFRS